MNRFSICFWMFLLTAPQALAQASDEGAEDPAGAESPAGERTGDEGAEDPAGAETPAGEETGGQDAEAPAGGETPAGQETGSEDPEEPAGAESPAGQETGGAAEASPNPVSWRDIASPYDIERIEANDAGFAEALAISKTSGSPADRDELNRLLAALPQEIDPDALPGRWECRTIRFVDQPASFRIYDWFDCQISALSDGLLLEKLGGSELTSGYLYPESPTRLIYLGHAHSQAEPARDYDGAEGAEGDNPANRDDPGILTQRGPDRLLLAKPAPVGPPAYDFLDLRRP